MDCKKFMELVEEKKRRALERMEAPLRWEQKLEAAAKAKADAKAGRRKHRREKMPRKRASSGTDESDYVSEFDGREKRRSHKRHRHQSSDSDTDTLYSSSDDGRKRRKLRCHKHDAMEDGEIVSRCKKHDRRRSDDDGKHGKHQRYQYRSRSSNSDSEERESSGSGAGYQLSDEKAYYKGIKKHRHRKLKHGCHHHAHNLDKMHHVQKPAHDKRAEREMY